MTRFITIIAAVLTALRCFAQTTEEVRALIDKEDYSAAAEMAREWAETDANSVGSYNALLGEALYLSGDRQGAEEALRKATAKGVADAYRWLGRMAYDRYDFGTASADYAKYFDMKKKASKPISSAAEEENGRIALAKRYLTRVEHIQVIDSLTVPRAEFFKHYRLPSSAGRLLGREDVPGGAGESDVGTMVYENERGDLRMWARLDSAYVGRIAQSVKLTDGTWHEPVLTDSVLNIGDANYPFMTSDGLTLYYASDGPQSIGGLDIFMATRDPSDDSYRLPQNIGMPYNSPADDYLLAIDEENNVGWWASDRNALGDEVTIYIFIPNEIRENYPEDTENLADLARLTDIRATWNESEEYDGLLATIRAIDPAAQAHGDDFRFTFPDGTVYTRWSDFKDERARGVMETYLDTQANLDKCLADIASLRKAYYERPSESTADKIEGLEVSLEAYYKALRRQRSDIVRNEKL